MFWLRMESNREGETWSDSQYDESIKHERAPDHPGHGDPPEPLFDKASWPGITFMVMPGKLES